MRYGLGAALTWALDTVILSMALACSTFFSTEQAIALAAFTSTFLHDACSAAYMFVYMAVRGKLRRTWAVLRSRTGLFIVLAAVIGAPIGMTGYMTAINNIGASYTAAISAFFPAFGALLSHLFLKERMKGYQWVGLMACLVGVAALGWTPAENIPGDWFLGVAGALVCVFGWGTEAVIIAYGLRDDSVDDENALQIRQTTSALSYALFILPILGGWAPATQAFASDAMPIIAAAALLGTVSYLCYYKAIARIGAAKSMALNITYSAWAIPFSLLLLGIMPDARGVVCAIVIIVGAITASTDFKELFSRGKAAEEEGPAPEAPAATNPANL